MVKEYLVVVVHNNNMDQKKQKQPEEGNDTPAAEAQGTNQIMPHPLSRPPTQTAGPSAFSAYPRTQQYSHSHDSHSHKNIHHLQQQELQKNLDEFWAKQYQEIEDDSTDFKTHCLPLARIKKIMKADEDVKMISAEAPMLFAKACEMFIMELTMRAWANAEVNKRRTLQKSDIASAISRTDVFDFLVDIVPKEDSMEHEVFLGMPRRDTAPIGNVPYYYVPVPVPVPVPPQHAAAGSSYGPPLPPPRMLMGRPFFDQPNYRQKLPAVPLPFATRALQIPKEEDHSQASDDDSDD